MCAMSPYVQSNPPPSLLHHIDGSNVFFVFFWVPWVRQDGTVTGVAQGDEDALTKLCVGIS